MGKLITKMILTVLIAVGASNYGLYLMTGKSPFDKLEMPSLPVSADGLKDLSPLPGKKETTYKWVDAKGVTHYSTEAPPESQTAEVIEVDPNVNIIQSVAIPESESTEEKPTEITPVQGPIYSPSNIQKIMDDAKNVEKVLKERFEKQEEILKEL